MQIITGINKMAKKEELKTFNMRIPYELLHFLKMQAANEQVSMTHIILKAVDEHRQILNAGYEVKKEEKKSVNIDQNELNNIMSALNNAQKIIKNMS